jgi:hypothetical protein
MGKFMKKKFLDVPPCRSKKQQQQLYLYARIIRMIKSRRMRWAGHVVHMGRRGMHIGY